MTPPGPAHDEVVFRTLAAPGLEEDDLYAVRAQRGGESLWGGGMPSAFTEPGDGSAGEDDRRRRHEALMRKWEPFEDPGGASP